MERYWNRYFDAFTAQQENNGMQQLDASKYRLSIAASTEG